jgi:hypothetical protein
MHVAFYIPLFGQQYHRMVKKQLHFSVQKRYLNMGSLYLIFSIFPTTSFLDLFEMVVPSAGQ